MGDISNKSLAALLVVAIVVSVAGTWLVVNKAPGGLSQLTGRYDATVGVEILSNTAASLTDSTIAVQAAVSTGASTCAIDTEANTSVGCINVVNADDRIALQNVGTTVIDCDKVSDKNSSALTKFSVIQWKTACATGTPADWGNFATDSATFCDSLDQNGYAYEYVKATWSDTQASGANSLAEIITCV